MNERRSLYRASAAVTSWFGVSVWPLKNEHCMILGPNLTQKLSLEKQAERKCIRCPPTYCGRERLCVFVFLCVCGLCYAGVLV